MKTEREREKKRGTKRVGRTREQKMENKEGDVRGQSRVQLLSGSMTTMWGSALFVCGLKQTGDC